MALNGNRVKGPFRPVPSNDITKVAGRMGVFPFSFPSVLQWREMHGLHVAMVNLIACRERRAQLIDWSVAKLVRSDASGY
jgi:hypothetical protein